MKIVLLFTAMITCTVIGNLLLKLGADSGNRMMFGLLSIKSVIGLLFFGASVVIYAWVLQNVALNIAQSFAACQFIAVILASSWILSEPISLYRWIGIGLISAGILVVGATYVGKWSDTGGSVALVPETALHPASLMADRPE